MPVIYKILNILNNKMYVGSAINFNRRISNHVKLLKENRHHSIYLQNAWNKYGEEKFVFEIIECVNDKHNLLKCEQFFLDSLKPKYNMASKAGSLLGFKWTEEQKKKKQGINHHNFGKPAFFKGHKHTDETKEILSKLRIGSKHTDETLSKMKTSKLGEKNPMSGRTHSIESKEKNRNSHLGKITSLETKEKLSEKSKHAVNQFDINGIFIKRWDSIKEASENLLIGKTNISAACRNVTKYSGNYIWKYAN